MHLRGVINKVVAAAAVALALAAAATTARAEQPEQIHKLGLSAGTDVPVMVGGELEWAPTRWFVPAFGVGYLPGGYVRIVNAFVNNQRVEDLIHGTLQDSLALRFTARSFPFARWGLYVTFGYTFYTLGGGINVRDYLNEAGFNEQTKDLKLPQDEVTVDTTLHLLNVGLGYRFWLVRHISLSVEASYLFAVGSDSVTNLPDRGLDDGVDAFLNDILMTYVKAPMVSLRLGIHLF